MPSYTSPGSYTYDSSSAESIRVEMAGGEGADGEDETSRRGPEGTGGTGGTIDVSLDVSDLSTLDVVVGAATTDVGVGSGAAGFTDGQDGETGTDPDAGVGGGGAGSSAVAVNGTALTESGGGGGGGGGGASAGAGGDGGDGGGPGGGGGAGGDAGSATNAGDDGSDGSSSFDSAATIYVTSQSSGNAGDGSVTITELPDTPQNLTASASDGDTIALSWDAANGADQYNVYRDTSSGVAINTTPIATVSTTSYDDTGLLDGTAYHYVVTGVDTNGEEGAPSAEQSATTDLPAPTSLTATDVRATEVDLSWTANHDNGDTRIETDEDDTGSYTVDQTVAYTTESATITGLLNGQLYGLRVVADTADAEQEDQ